MSARLVGLLGPRGSSLRRAQALLLAAGAGLVALLAVLPPPWTLPGATTLVPGPRQPLGTTVRYVTWWAALADLALAALLFATARVWAGDSAPSAPPPSAGRAPMRAASLAILLAAAALAGALRLPLASGSLWWDEMWTLNHTVLGPREPARDDPNRLEHHPAPWEATFFEYRGPYNHVTYSVASRVSLRAWQRATGAEPWEFDELVYRLPAYAAALASVLLLGVLVHRLGFPRAAPAAALLLAIHPWHVRYGADGRAYSFVVLVAIAGSLALLRALRDGRLRSWLGFGLCQLLLLWTHLFGVYLALALAGAGAAGIWLGREERGERALRLARLAAANALAAMAFLLLMGAVLAQGVAYPYTFESPIWGAPHSAIPRNLWVFLATGMRAKMPGRPEVSEPTFAMLAADHPWMLAVVWGVLPALAALGLARALARGDGAARAVVAGLAAAPALCLVHQQLQRLLFAERYAIYAIVPLVACLAIGLEGALVGALRSERARRRLVPAGLALGLAGYQLLVLPRTLTLLRFPHAPSREVVEFLARESEREPNGAIRAGFGTGRAVPRIYDPRVELVKSREELTALCARARAEGRALLLYYGWPSLNRKQHPEAFALVEDARLFAPVGRFDAIEGGMVLRVVRWTGAPLDAP
jgi:hypothetical protein